MIEGISLYWDDKNLTIEEYGGKNKHYFCGKELLKFKESRSLVYSVLVLDYNDSCFADIYSDGEIDVRFNLHSEVPKKHKKGGQSAARFSRMRENEITKWFKRINEYLKQIDHEYYLGISPIYEKRFIKYLSRLNLDKIKETRNTEYCDLSGIYQFMNKLEVEKIGNKRRYQ